ncbi:MAG: hypothetical protein ACT4P1_12220 [Sporichthyaceae bacterium]
MRASKKVKGAVLLTAGAALVLGAPTVYADDIESSNNSGLLGGVQALNGAEINLPITVGGAGVLGVGKGDATVKAGNDKGGDDDGGSTKATSKDNSGILSGAQVGNGADVNAPITVCGVGAVLAKGAGDCDVKAGNGDDGDTKATSEDNSGVGGGLQALNGADVNAPISVCGLGVLGRGAADCDVKSGNGGGGNGDDDDDVDISSDDNDGVLGGLQLLNGSDVNAPVSVCGLAVLGGALGNCDVEAGNDDEDEVLGVKKDKDKNGNVRGAVLPKTGAAGLAVLPFGLALVAGGVALRRRVTSEA